MPNMAAKPRGIATGIPLPGSNNMSRMPQFPRDSLAARQNVAAVLPPGSEYQPISAPPSAPGKYGAFKKPQFLPAGAVPQTPSFAAPTRGMLTPPPPWPQTPHSFSFGSQAAPVYKGEGEAPAAYGYSEGWTNPLFGQSSGQGQAATPPPTYWGGKAKGAYDTLMAPAPGWESQKQEALDDIAAQSAMGRRALGNQMAGQGFGGSTGFIAQSQAALGQEEMLRNKAITDINNKRMMYDLQRQLAALDVMKSGMSLEQQREAQYMENAIKQKMLELEAMGVASDLYTNAATMKEEGTGLTPANYEAYIRNLMGEDF